MFVAEAGKGRICYTLAQPKTREPASLKRDPGYAFISDRPGEGVRNEVSFIMGFDVAGGGQRRIEARREAGRKARGEARGQAENARRPAPVASVDETTFEMLPKGGNLWVKNAAQESALIAEMRKGTKLVIKAASLQRPRIDRHLFAGRILAGDGPAAEGMSGELSGRLSPPAFSPRTCN